MSELIKLLEVLNETKRGITDMDNLKIIDESIIPILHRIRILTDLSILKTTIERYNVNKPDAPKISKIIPDNIKEMYETLPIASESILGDIELTGGPAEGVSPIIKDKIRVTI